MNLKEYAVKCDWCGAQPGEPCKTEDGAPVPEGKVHRPRVKLYEDTEINRLIASRPINLLPPKPRSRGKGCNR